MPVNVILFGDWPRRLVVTAPGQAQGGESEDEGRRWRAHRPQARRAGRRRKAILQVVDGCVSKKRERGGRRTPAATPPCHRMGRADGVCFRYRGQVAGANRQPRAGQAGREPRGIARCSARALAGRAGVRYRHDRFQPHSDGRNPGAHSARSRPTRPPPRSQRRSTTHSGAPVAAPRWLTPRGHSGRRWHRSAGGG